jgi:hypothetical protein
VTQLKGGTSKVENVEKAQFFTDESLRQHPIGQFLDKCGQQCACPVIVYFQCGECCLRICNAKISGISSGFLTLQALSLPGLITAPCPCEEEENDNGPDLQLMAKPGHHGKHHNTVPTCSDIAQCALIPLDRVCCIQAGVPAAMALGAEE